MFHKAYELLTECEAECWMIIRRKGRFDLFDPLANSERPPNWSDIVRYLKSVFHFPSDVLQANSTKYPVRIWGPESLPPNISDERGVSNGPSGHEAKDLGEADCDDRRANKIKTEDSDAEDRRCFRNLPALIELDVSPVQEKKVYHLE